MQIAGMVMENEDRDWVLDSEGYKLCEQCNELSMKTDFIHGVCLKCHGDDNSQCEGCYQRSIK